MANNTLTSHLAAFCSAATQKKGKVKAGSLKLLRQRPQQGRKEFYHNKAKQNVHKQKQACILN